MSVIDLSTTQLLLVLKLCNALGRVERMGVNR